ncbi:glycoside hydrolase family 3 N-terminal domain-containing protein [Neolewinella lacunae]|uniref:beta-N-acetylhexosaminidase n=1 Tax=Neolewinella lacunae TaxID=1517758 RepID=A0A923PQT8_9BACT|nr:glycoside hydrolase family 3 N-terminal domain-containing protein [Neolewinella lacunae]MBC6995763.1 serine hydrolase [Neolewinella lacunae]MDN3636544.1 glycoside hydrolase family 3 N-terminal domain-containing protein [Neolewinella lacunae]
MKLLLSLRFTLLLLLGACASLLTAQKPYLGDLSYITPEEQRWVDSVYQTLSPDGQLGQLFMLRAHSDRGPEHIAQVRAEIERYQVGGLCFFQGTPEKQLELTNIYQHLSRVPLFVSMDAEWGLGMRLPDQTISFPKQIALGAIRKNELLYDLGAEIARQMHRIGVNVSFSPVLDINNNPSNPVINTRSFGEDRYNVTIKGYQYMKGLQENGIMASAKHFPGHGDTNVDSHYGLPVIAHPRARLDSLELYPFQSLIRYGIGSIMAAHLQIPALDSRPNRPSSLSKPIVTNLLRQEMGFTGLVFTDGLEMEGVTKHYGNGEVEAEAIAAGSDILLLPESTPAAFAAIKRYLAEGKITQDAIEEKVRRILLAKHRLGLTRATFPPVENLRGELNPPEAYALKQKLFENAMTLVRDSDGLVPITGLEKRKTIAVHVGLAAPTAFSTRLDDYGKVTHLNATYGVSPAERSKIIDGVSEDDLVIVALYSDGSRFLEKVPVGPEVLALLRGLDAKARLIVTVFGNPYSLSALDGAGTVLMAYSRDEVAQDAAAQALFGANKIDGRLPITASPAARFNAGIETHPVARMGYAKPEATGIDGNLLAAKVGILAREAMARKATPGMVVLVARQGKIVYEEAFGYHTYRKKRPVYTNDVYDLASVTKVAATTLSIMKLVDDGKLDLDVPIRQYLPDVAGTPLESLTLRPILAHRAGLRSWIPFYQETLNPSKKPSSQWYRTEPTGDFRIPVTEKLFLHRDYVDSIWHQIYTNELPNVGEYRYSDLGFYLMAKIVDQVSGYPLDEYADRNFYRPMGLTTLTYNPLGKVSKSRIPPTEEDKYFRQGVVQGTVHDMGAAMLGGVSGHAGLFGTASDLATIFQMLLQEGSYGGRQYLRPETVRLFTSRYANETRRGLGFDMMQLNPKRKMNLSPLASERAFGHLGFTGTAVWADPVEDLVFVVLSNRTYPSMNNNLFSNLDTRVRLHTAVYESIQREDVLVALPPLDGKAR